jgi:hypothetical protein
MDLPKTNKPNMNQDQTEKRLGLFFMAGAAMLLGLTGTEWFATNITSKELPGLAYNAIIGFGFLIWLSADCKSSGKNASKPLKFFAVFLPQLTAFIYAFNSRGFKGGLVQSIKILGFSLALFGLAMIPSVLLNEI